MKMFSYTSFFRSLIILPFTFRPIISLKAVFVRGLRSGSMLNVFFHRSIKLLKHHLLRTKQMKRKTNQPIPLCITLATWLKISWLYIWRSTCGVCPVLLFYASVFMSVPHRLDYYSFRVIPNTRWRKYSSFPFYFSKLCCLF